MNEKELAEKDQWLERLEGLRFRRRVIGVLEADNVDAIKEYDDLIKIAVEELR